MRRYKRYIAFTLTSQTLVLTNKGNLEKYRYSYLATLTNEKAENCPAILRNFAVFSKISLSDIFKCSEDVTNVEVSRDNISDMYTLRFCSSKDLYRNYTGEIFVNDDGSAEAKLLAHSDS